MPATARGRGRLVHRAERSPHRAGSPQDETLVQGRSGARGQQLEDRPDPGEPRRLRDGRLSGLAGPLKTPLIGPPRPL
jgi:hypothetical protein